MKKKQLLSAISAAAMLLSSVGCSLPGKKNKGQEIQKFTGFYCARKSTNLEEDNEIRQIIAEKTGYILYEEWLRDQADIDKIISDMMISGKYPDFISPDGPNCQRLIRQKAFIPLDNYWDKYPNLKALYSDAQWDTLRAEDGHIYFIPLFSAVNQQVTGNVHDGEAFWIQVKVLEWANYPELKTLDDYFDLIEDYIAANPVDENGEPYIGYEIEATEVRMFALDNPPMFLDGYPNDGCCYVDPDTLEAKDYNLLPTAKKWFKKLNEEYHKGIIDQECFVMDDAAYYDKLATGRVLGMVDQHWNFGSSERQLPAECTYIPIGITIDEDTVEHYRDNPAFNASTGVGVSVSCSDPDGAVEFMSKLIEPEILNLRFWGVEGVDYFINDDGYFDQTEEQYNNWRDDDYSLKHKCMYSYMPHYGGMAPDGVNAYTAENQPNIFHDHLAPSIKKCFDAYGKQTYRDFLNTPAENPAWYPMWSFEGAATDATEYGKVSKKINEIKLNYMPLLVMSNDFEKSWEEYNTAYNAVEPQIYFDALTAEVRRRCSIINGS
ncbi:sugar ABC transporter substrate-binding protein [Ruminococcus flavefaciens]|uniref:sugar ABC transporter substrate-binding protein n=1 Tax=Ruminococcus flavefaciens TaxID=1265 RepID=UPI000463ECF4|nr:sugar ABC transporter substrate-binding protein [Ruminococcus flavefaciens]